MRKYTMEYYLQFIRNQNTPQLMREITQYSNTVVKDIQNRYKKLSKGGFIDYIARYEDFYIITTYRIEDMLTCAFCVIRYRNGKKHFQYYEKYHSYPGYCWVRHKMNHGIKRYLYSKNLKELFEETEYKYSEIWTLAENIDVSARNLLGYCDKERLLMAESLTKMKCYRLAKDLINGKFFAHTKEIIKKLGFKCYKDFLPVVEKDMSYEQMRQYRNLASFDLPNKYHKYFKKFAMYRGIEDMNPQTMSSRKFVEYYLEQLDNGLTVNNFEDFYNDYKDYVRFGTKLDYDFNDTKYYKPSNFKIAHDMAFMKVKSVEALKQKSALKKVFKKQKMFSYEDEIYSIIIPTKVEDIIQEGIDMKNCVGGYIDRIVEGNSYIFFVRHTADPSKSFYTLELNPKTMKVVQCRGYNNNPTREEKKVQSFVKKWEREIITKYSKKAVA